MGLIPEAIEHHQAEPVLLVILAGLFGFFFLEKILRLPHMHGHAAARHGHSGEHHTVQPAGLLILVGDAFHNFVDGVVIATAFSISIELGVLTSLAVVAHEVPQELGDFTILLESGWSPRKAYWLNFASASATLPGAVLAYVMLGAIEPYTPYLLAIAAASFLYIATVDLAPILHHESAFKKSLVQMAGLFLGVGTIAGLHHLLG
jgi:zinc and cadmium transporter